MYLQPSTYSDQMEQQPYFTWRIMKRIQTVFIVFIASTGIRSLLCQCNKQKAPNLNPNPHPQATDVNCYQSQVKHSTLPSIQRLLPTKCLPFSTPSLHPLPPSPPPPPTLDGRPAQRKAPVAIDRTLQIEACLPLHSTPLHSKIQHSSQKRATNKSQDSA